MALALVVLPGAPFVDFPDAPLVAFRVPPLVALVEALDLAEPPCRPTAVLAMPEPPDQFPQRAAPCVAARLDCP
jgi:hypothetical protein